MKSLHLLTQKKKQKTPENAHKKKLNLCKIKVMLPILIQPGGRDLDVVLALWA